MRGSQVRKHSDLSGLRTQSVSGTKLQFCRKGSRLGRFRYFKKRATL